MVSDCIESKERGDSTVLLRGEYLKCASDIEVDRATLSVDGEVVASWNAEQIKAEACSYTCPSDAKAHEVSLAVWDKAGNKSVHAVSNVVVAADLFAYLAANPARLFGVICTGIAALGVLGNVKGGRSR